MQLKDLNEYPQPAVYAQGEQLAAMNEGAQALFSTLKPGDALPEVLCAPGGEERWEGAVPLEGRMYRVAAVREGEGTLYLFRPQEQQALSEAQLDGALYQVRTLMGQFRRELAPYVAGEQTRFAPEDMEEFSRSYYRMLRLMDHLDLLRDAAAGQLRTDKQRLELGSLCAQAAVECSGLLRELGVAVDYEGLPAPVFVSGDEQLLRSAILELISNCARRRREGGRVSLRLSKKGGWARICVTDDGPAATKRERLTLTNRGAMPLIPTADAGAGLGLSTAETVLRLHGGALLTGADGDAPRVYLMLPIDQSRGGSLSLHAPRAERNLGMNPYLIALSDVLPGRIIREDWKE